MAEKIWTKNKSVKNRAMPVLQKNIIFLSKSP